MSVQSQIDRIEQNVANTYNTLGELGADMPATQNSDNLSETVISIKTVLYGKEQSLSDEQKAQARQNIGAISEVDVPQKGVDYWTDADQEAIVQQVIIALGGTPFFGVVDSDNNIILSGKLADGTYTIKYEDAEGNTTVIGTLEHISEPEPAPEPDYISILDTYELQFNKRWSASGKKWSDCNGMLSIAVPFADIKDKVVRFTGFSNITTLDSNSSRWYAINSGSATQYGMFVSSTTGGTTDDMFSSKLVNEGNGTYSIAITSENIGVYDNASVTKIMMCMPVNNTGTAIDNADLANLSMIIADE